MRAEEVADAEPPGRNPPLVGDRRPQRTLGSSMPRNVQSACWARSSSSSSETSWLVSDWSISSSPSNFRRARRFASVLISLRTAFATTACGSGPIDFVLSWTPPPGTQTWPHRFQVSLAGQKKRRLLSVAPPAPRKTNQHQYSRVLGRSLGSWNTPCLAMKSSGKFARLAACDTPDRVRMDDQEKAQGFGYDRSHAPRCAG